MIYWEEIKQKVTIAEAAGPSTARRDIPVEDVPRTTLAGLEATSPELDRDIVIELRGVRDMDPREPEPELLSQSVRIHLDLMNQEMQLLELRPCQGLPRVMWH